MSCNEPQRLASGLDEYIAEWDLAISYADTWAGDMQTIHSAAKTIRQRKARLEAGT